MQQQPSDRPGCSDALPRCAPQAGCNRSDTSELQAVMSTRPPKWEPPVPCSVEVVLAGGSSGGTPALPTVPVDPGAEVDCEAGAADMRFWVSVRKRPPAGAWPGAGTRKSPKLMTGFRSMAMAGSSWPCVGSGETHWCEAPCNGHATQHHCGNHRRKAVDSRHMPEV
jgi:hypothetical protein